MSWSKTVSALHLKESESLSRWKVICLDAGVGASPMSTGWYMPLKKIVFTFYNAASIIGKSKFLQICAANKQVVSLALQTCAWKFFSIKTIQNIAVKNKIGFYAMLKKIF